MKEWHVVVLEGHKILFDKIFFKVEDARRVEKEKREEFAEQIAAKKVQVSREYY